MDLDVILHTSFETPPPLPPSRKVEVGTKTWDDSAPSKTLIISEQRIFIGEWSSANVISTSYELHLSKTQKKNKRN